MFYLFRIRRFLICLFILCVFIFYKGSISLVWCSNLVFNNYFIFDSLSFYLIVLVIFLGIYRILLFFSILSVESKLFLFFRNFFSILCFCINHSILFWCFYELSMLPLLYLIFKESPYSERFLAGWYFSAYLLVTRLPLILVLIYLSFINNRFFISHWGSSDVNKSIYFFLAFIFFTKIPLVPFHTWLPIVHAEATSIVSIFLSGYIMKLGLLGVYRCSYFIFDFNFVRYLFICCIFCIFFLLTASTELDGKRWLAFLSLSHIVVPFFGLFVCDFGFVKFSFLYCLGHGLSAGIVFGLLWYFYDLSKRRNWLLIKHSIGGPRLMFITIFRMLSLCSFPPTIQFFSEVCLVKMSFTGLLFIMFWCLYLFFRGLVPLVLCGHLLLRREFCEELGFSYFRYIFYLFFLCTWCYLGLVVL